MKLTQRSLAPLSLLLVISCHISAAINIPLNHGWQFSRPGETPTAVTLPHDFQISQPWIAPEPSDTADLSDMASNVRSKLSARAFKESGTGTYTLSFTLPASLEGKRILLDFEGIMLTGKATLNGKSAGGTDYGYLGFETDVTDIIKFNEPNILNVEASTGAPENSRWYTGGGLYRPVSVRATDPNLYIGRHGLYVTTPHITPEAATVNLEIDINSKGNDRRIIILSQIYDMADNIVSEHRDTIAVDSRWPHREYAIAPHTVRSPYLWDTESPYLYGARVVLCNESGVPTDTVSGRFGIREISYSPEHGFMLNGRKVILKGIANHHTLGPLGAAAHPEAIEARLRMLRDFGFNHIRTSHNPYSREFMELCDKMGFLVVDELYDKWLQQYAGGTTPFEHRWQQDIPEFIKRDRNHPSVVMWSLGNELQGYANLPFNDWGVTAYKLQKTLLERYDRTRPVTVAMHPRRRDLATDSLPAPLALITDIAAYNYRYMYFPGDRKRFPDMIFYQSEANLSNMGPNYWTPDSTYVVGLAYWGMIDYLGESNGWPAKGWTLGVFDITLRPKPMAWFLKSIWSDEPVTHIAVDDPNAIRYDWNGVEMIKSEQRDHWNFAPGDTLSIYVYNNADEVELFLNNLSLGRRINNTSDMKERNRTVWKDILWQPGTLTAIAYKNGHEWSRHSITTAGIAHRLKASVERTQSQQCNDEVIMVNLDLVDKKGRTVPDDTRMLTFETDGNIELLAVANGNMYSDESYTSDRRRLHNGRAQAIVRVFHSDNGLTAVKGSGRKKTRPTLRITAPGLDTLSLTF